MKILIVLKEVVVLFPVTVKKYLPYLSPTVIDIFNGKSPGV